MTLLDYLRQLAETANENQRKTEAQIRAIQQVLIDNDLTTPEQLERYEAIALTRIDQAWVTPVYQLSDL